MGHRTPHSAHVARLVDAQASGSVHVGEIDERKAAPRCALPPRDATIFVVSAGEGEFWSAGQDKTANTYVIEIAI